MLEISPDNFPDVNLEDTPLYEMYEDDKTDAKGSMAGNTEDDEETVMSTGLDRDIPTPEVNEKYVDTSVMLPIGNIYAIGKFIAQKRDAYWNSVGRINNNPILDTRKYCVEFDDREVSELMENVIEESMYAACDDSGNEYLVMGLIVDYQKSDKAISVSNQKVVHRGQNFTRQYTIGWQICVQWRDGSTSWQVIKYLKELHPVETAEYAMNQEIHHEPTFRWWVNTVLNKRLRIISLVKKRNSHYLNKTQKFGIEVPKYIMSRRSDGG